MRKILPLPGKISCRFSSPIGMAVLPDPADCLHRGPGRRHRRPSDSRIRLVVVDQAHSSLSAELIADAGPIRSGAPRAAACRPGRGSVRTRRASVLLVIPPDLTWTSSRQAARNWNCASSPTT